jgi:DNA repair exonuclease SbcCD ATPase subunit
MSASKTDTDTVKQDPGGVVSTPSEGGASIDKVRDILFGSHLREFERRFARLEERLVKETNDLKEDVRSRLEALETFARKETASLADQIRAEHDARVDSNSSASRELSEAANSFERRTRTLDEQLTKNYRELREQMLEQHQRLSDDIRKKADDVLATLAREAQELRSDKADRAALASLLTEMAMRLTDDFRIPGAEAAGNA